MLTSSELPLRYLGISIELCHRPMPGRAAKNGPRKVVTVSERLGQVRQSRDWGQKTTTTKKRVKPGSRSGSQRLKGDKFGSRGWDITGIKALGMGSDWWQGRAARKRQCVLGAMVSMWAPNCSQLHIIPRGSHAHVSASGEC